MLNSRQIASTGSSIHCGSKQPPMQLFTTKLSRQSLFKHVNRYQPSLTLASQLTATAGPESCSHAVYVSPQENLTLLPRGLHTSQAQHSTRFSSPKQQHQAQPHLTECSEIFIENTSKVQQAQGHVEVIVGPMFAGKTTLLLSRARELRAQGLNIMLVKSSKDTRYSADHIKSHAGDALPCAAVENLSDIFKLYRQDYRTAQVVAIDEAQFFSDLHTFVEHAADRDCKAVLLAGLDGDFKRKRFGQVLDVVPLADKVTRLTAKCFCCDRPALFSLRLTTEGHQELVGGADKYRPACRHHYKQLSGLKSTWSWPDVCSADDSGSNSSEEEGSSSDGAGSSSASTSASNGHGSGCGRQ